jgi:hypothetical protein
VKITESTTGNAVQVQLLGMPTLLHCAHLRRAN